MGNSRAQYSIPGPRRMTKGSARAERVSEASRIVVRLHREALKELEKY
jgi:hypothetical protein